MSFYTSVHEDIRESYPYTAKSYLKAIDVLCEEQNGFREGYSIVITVNDVIDFIYKNVAGCQIEINWCHVFRT